MDWLRDLVPSVRYFVPLLAAVAASALALLVTRSLARLREKRAL